jgi:putative SOS response-associated peptidase YedK
MCDRFTFAIDKWTIEKYFGAKFYIAQLQLVADVNAAPSQMRPISRT